MEVESRTAVTLREALNVNVHKIFFTYFYALTPSCKMWSVIMREREREIDTHTHIASI
jgi:hypothetical protein